MHLPVGREKLGDQPPEYSAQDTEQPQGSQIVFVEREASPEPQCCGCTVRFCLLLLLGVVIIIQAINILFILVNVITLPGYRNDGIAVFTALAIMFLLLNIYGFWANSARNLQGMFIFLLMYISQTIANAAYNLYYIFSTPREIRDYGFGTFTVTLILNFIVFWKLFTNYQYSRTLVRHRQGALQL